MSDLFHENVPLDFIRRVFATMEACPRHTFQVLTKRSRRLRQPAASLPWPKNVWMGVSIEDDRELSRVADLRAVPAEVRFLSCEPLIGPVDDLPLDGISWVIVGGESGPGEKADEARLCRVHPPPAQRVFLGGGHKSRTRPDRRSGPHAVGRRQCRRAGVAFFFKQWGGVRKDLAGRLLNGRTYDDMPAPSRPPSSSRGLLVRADRTPRLAGPGDLRTMSPAVERRRRNSSNRGVTLLSSGRGLGHL